MPFVSALPNVSVELVTSPWETKFYSLVELAQEELLVASPFLSAKPLEKIVEIVSGKEGINLWC